MCRPAWLTRCRPRSTRGLAAVGPVPDEGRLPGGGEGLGQLADARRLLGESAAGGDGPGLVPLADDLVRDGPDRSPWQWSHGPSLHRPHVEKTSSSSTPTRHWSSRPISSPVGRPASAGPRAPRREVDGEPSWMFDGQPARPATPPERSSAATATSSSHRLAQTWTHRGRPRRRLRPEGAARGARRVRHRRPGHLPDTIGLGGQDLGDDRRPGPEPHDGRDLQRPHGRDPGRAPATGFCRCP